MGQGSERFLTVPILSAWAGDVDGRRGSAQLAFRHGAAEFAEDFTQGNLRGLLTDLGFAKPQLARTIKQIASLAVRISEVATTLATKELADALHAQAKVVEAALEADFGLPARDFYDRISWDDGQECSGGWGGLS